MQQALKHFIRATLLASLAGLAGVGLTATSTHAQNYTKLQVLLPGETAAPGTGTGKAGTPRVQTVGFPFTVTVRACDDSWNTMTSVSNVVSLTSSDATATLPSNVSLINGEITMSVTFNASGQYTVTATDESDGTIPQATSSIATTMLFHALDFAKIKEKDQKAGVPIPITIYAVDPTGAVITGFDGAVGLMEMTSFGVGRITPDEVMLTDGEWSGDVTVYRADKTPGGNGAVTIQAWLVSDPTLDGTSNSFVVKPGPYHRVQLVVPGQTPLPGSVTGLIGSPASQAATQNFIVDVYATDEWWNLLDNKDDRVRIVSSDPLASTPVEGKMDRGYAAFTISLGTVGLQTLTLTNDEKPEILGMTCDPILVTASAPDHFVIDPIPSPVTAGVPVTVSIRATDVNDNTVPDYNGDAILIANTGPESISPTAITFANGLWSGQVTFRGAGALVSFVCSDFAAPPHTGTSNSFQVLAGPYTGLQVLLPGQTPRGGTATGFEGMPTDQNAGTSFNITIRAVDMYWNRVTGINNRIALSSTDEFADMPTDTTLGNGELVLPVTLFRSGFQTITASDIDSTGISPHTSSPVELFGGTYSRLLILAPGERLAPGTISGRAGTPIDQSINFAFTVTVYATDEWYNPVFGVTDMVHLTSTDPLAQLDADTTLTDGRADMSVRLATGGFQLITASNVDQPTMPTSSTQVLAISSGFHLEADVTPLNVQAGEQFTLTVRVTNDAGSVITEIFSLITIEVRNASTGEPGAGVLATSQFQLIAGERTMPETYTFAEPIILVATDDAGNAPAITEVVTVVPGPPSVVELASDPSWLGGNQHATLSARVVDAFDNGIPDQPVIFSLVSGSGTVTPIDSLTDATGLATCDFLSPRNDETSRIRAASNSLFSEIDIQTALVDPSLPSGSITNYPNPFHPDEGPTTVAYKLADDANVTIRIYTLTGGLVLTEKFAIGTSGGLAGLNQYAWDGSNGNGAIVASGGYILEIEAEGNGQTTVMRRKIAVVR